MTNECEDQIPLAMYHYTNPSAWNGMNHGQGGYMYNDPRTGEYVESENARGLWPEKRLVAQGPESRLVPYEATSPAIFGFTEEKPNSWIDYKDGIFLFDKLIKCCASLPNEFSCGKLVLIEVELTPEDKPMVVEYLHVRRIARPFEAASGWEEKQRIWAKGMKDYWDSRVPLEKYGGSFTLPEVIVFTPIPLERLSFVWEKELYSFLDEAHRRA